MSYSQHAEPNGFSFKNNPFLRPSIQTPRLIARSVNAFLLPSLMVVALLNEAGQVYAQALDASISLTKRNTAQMTWPFSRLY